MKNIFNEDTIKTSLIIAGIYNIFMALLFIFAPHFILSSLNLVSLVNAAVFFKFIGIFIGIMGVGFILSSSDLQNHWGIILLGILIKFLCFLGLLKSTFSDGSSSHLIIFGIVNDLIWIIPFFYALNFAYEGHNAEESLPKQFSDLVKIAKTNDGKTLNELSQDKRVLLVFVRHLGCTFCRETVHEISKLESVIKSKNYNLVFVHMSDPAFGDDFFFKYFSYPVSHISDPQRLLYQSLGMRRGSLAQLFGPSTFIRGFWAGFIKGHGLGRPEGDPMQLGGCFVISKGHIVFEHKATKASEAFDPNIIPEV
jgi:peroxiredoxin